MRPEAPTGLMTTVSFQDWHVIRESTAAEIAPFVLIVAKPPSQGFSCSEGLIMRFTSSTVVPDAAITTMWVRDPPTMPDSSRTAVAAGCLQDLRSGVLKCHTARSTRAAFRCAEFLLLRACERIRGLLPTRRALRRQGRRERSDLLR